MKTVFYDKKQQKGIWKHKVAFFILNSSHYPWSNMLQTLER